MDFFESPPQSEYLYSRSYDYSSMQLLEFVKKDERVTYLGDPNRLDETGMAPIHYAAKNIHDNSKVMGELLNCRADIDLKNSFFRTALHIAVSNINEEISIFLIERNANVDETEGVEEKTPLHIVIESGESGRNIPKKISIIETLLEYEADVDACDIHHETPLMYAAKDCYSVQIVKLLVNVWANVFIKNDDDETCFDIAVNSLDQAEHLEVIFELMKEGFPLIPADRRKWNAIEKMKYSKKLSSDEKDEILERILKMICLLHSPERITVRMGLRRRAPLLEDCFAERLRMHSIELHSIELQPTLSLYWFARDGSESSEIWISVLDILMTTTFDLYIDFLAAQLPRWFLIQQIFDLGIYTMLGTNIIEFKRAYYDAFCQYFTNTQLIDFIIALRKSPAAT